MTKTNYERTQNQQNQTNSELRANYQRTNGELITKGELPAN